MDLLGRGRQRGHLPLVIVPALTLSTTHLGIRKTRNGRVWKVAPERNHSTVTDFAKFLG